MNERLTRLVEKMHERKIDGVVLGPGATLYYFTGLVLHQSERITLCLITKDQELFAVVPQVEKTKAEEVLTQAKLFWYTDEEGPSKALGQLPLKGKIGLEFGVLRVMELTTLQEVGLNHYLDFSEDFNTLRLQKDQSEIALFQKAVAIVEESLEATLPYIKAGVNELEIAAQLEYEMRRRGSEGTPFGTIVASGYRGALPHGRAADKIMETGELVVLDFGSIYKGYVADITRTVAIGQLNNKLKEIYETVKIAQQTAINLVKPGITAHEVDKAAREVITDKGYGEYFTHRTGHGIGLGAHESPYIMKNNHLKLSPGMAFTIEPGIYLPGKGGVRIEDNVVVTETGALNLMSYTKELIICE